MKKEDLKYRIIKKIMFCTGIIMLLECICPAAAFALTSGPSQPEFSSFEPVATTNMVSDFTGDFMYNVPVLNIPGANGGGYAMSLSYHSGASPEEEASWVGYGWTLNPGAVNRGKQGFPDDFNGAKVNYWNKRPANWTVTLGGSLAFEAFSKDLKNIIGGGASATLRYNNYKGFGSSKGVNFNVAKGLVSLGYNISDGDGSFSARVNPMAILSLMHKEQDRIKEDHSVKDGVDKLKSNWKSRSFNTNALTKGVGSLALVGSNYGIFSHKGSGSPTIMSKYKGASYNVSFGFIPTALPLELGPNAQLSGTYTRQENVNAAGESGKADIVDVYGYMYTANAVATNQIGQMDYRTDKDNAYDKRDYYIGMPFSNADNFAVTGEGVGGGFRMYNNKIGQFMPRQTTSSVTSWNVGAEIEAGWDVGGGIDAGVGFQRFTGIGWNNRDGFGEVDNIMDEPYFFRFNNDKGGYYGFNSDDLQAADIDFWGGKRGNKNFGANISSINNIANKGDRSGRSSYIAYHTNEEMSLTANSKRYKAYSNSDDVGQWITRTNPVISKGIGEFTTFNEDGMCYVYGLPVYSRNEINMSYDVNDATNIKKKYLVYKSISDDALLKTKIGEESATPYASSCLLTEITTPDYLDRTMNGPTDDDFGGYTRFSYKRVYGHNEKDNATPWYRWRIPYTGMQYSRGELSNLKDDMGTVSAGEKEIYYLDSVITKTNYAVFVTSQRNDGFEAADNNTAANSTTAKGTKQLRKLDAIKLFAKNPGAQPKLIQTVRFEYYNTESDANTLCKGLPNGYTPGTTGKLTLKRVWVEYEGAFNAKISPYEFEYKYPVDGIYPSKYSTLDNYGTGKTENPNYSAHNVDAWGNYQASGDNRYDSLKTWVNQKPPASFDPAAWQLKLIRLPSGGEIHVQYEQDDYRYVQDRHAEAMVNIASIDGDKYYLDINKSFANNTTNDKNYILNLLQKDYVDGDKKIFFKFLYKLLLGAPGPNLESCSSEYISGYCNIKEAGVDGTGLYVKLGRKWGGVGSKFDLPVKVCRDFVKKERIGMLNTSGNCSQPPLGIDENTADAKRTVKALLAFIGSKMVPGSTEMCTEIKNELSYFRIPVPSTGKKGGGIRVSRLLMYDKGIETGDKALYGSEYVYKDEDGYSSGVASNEPGALRQENALVEFDPRLKQKFRDKIISGRDRDQTEKPLGESILPSASVGYSRIVIKNIHSGKTNTGFAVKEFYTAKDAPVKVEYTDLSNNKYKKDDYLIIPAGLFNYNVNNVWLSQGFVCKVNDMHGQPKRDATYGGDPTDSKRARLSTETAYEYFQPGEDIPVSSSPGIISYQDIGKETELVMESRGIEDISHDVQIESDLSVGFAFAIPVVQYSIVPSYTYNESKLYTHATNKVVQYPAIQKRVRTYAEGIYHLTENIAFNPHTGKPDITRSYDGYNGLKLEQSVSQKGYYTDFDIAASWSYSGMGQKANNERFTIKSDAYSSVIKKQDAGGINITFSEKMFNSNSNNPSGFDPCDAVSRFYPGDLIKLTKTSDGTNAGIFHVTDSTASGTTGDPALDYTKLYLKSTKSFKTTDDDASIDVEMTVEVLRSGCTNQLSSSAGSFSTYGESNIITPDTKDRAAFVSILNELLPEGKVYSTDRFFKDHTNMKINISGVCIPFTYPDGTFDASGTNTVFRDATGYIKIQFSGLFPAYRQFSLTLYRGASMSQCNTVTQSFMGGNCFGGVCFGGGSYGFTSDDYPRLGKFALTPDSLELYYYPHKMGTCSGLKVNCLDLCPNKLFSTVTQVVKAGAQTYDSKWPYDTTLYKPVKASNDYEAGVKGKWRPLSSYAYRDTILGANASLQRSYTNAGIFDMKLFNWKTIASNDTTKWIKINTVTKYAPDGNSLEEKDIFGICKSAKFGYSKTQPYLVAKNANYASVQFESFEKTYSVYTNTELEDGWAPSGISTKRNSTYAHAGSYSWKLVQNDSIPFKPITVTQQMLDNGISVKVWVNDTALTTGTTLKFNLKKSAGPTVYYTANRVARTGEWCLYEAKAVNISGSYSLGNTITPWIINAYTNKTIWIDDVRLQPLDAIVMAYVYDINTLRPIASFDDQHFGLFYQYNGQGKLVRKLVETERGIKTITETQYHSAQQKGR